MSLEKHKSLTYLNGLSLIIGLVIGSGIFSSPSQVNVNAGSPGASLLVWTIAGILAWTGAASYAELGGAIPLNGGAQVYLAKIFGDWLGFLFTWSAVLVLKPGGAAIIAIIFGEYIVRGAVGADAENVSAWINKGFAIGGLVLVTFCNAVSTKVATRMGDMFMVLKFVGLLGVTVIGVVVAVTGFSYHDNPLPQEWETENWFQGTSSDLSSWAVALYAGLWAYDGWDNTNYVVGEFVHPSRDLPRVIHTAMPIVILCYLLANLAYIFVLPAAVIASNNTVAVKLGSVVFGPAGSLALALVVSASCFGALNATTFTSGRLVYAAGQEGFLPSFLGTIGMPGLASESQNNHSLSASRRSTVRRLVGRWLGDSGGTLFLTPISALVFNTLLTTLYILVGEFGTLVTFYGVAGYSFYFLTVLGLIVLRVKEPYLERPYKTWISTPIVFCCVSLFLLSRAVVAQPIQTLVVLGFVGAGLPVYWIRVKTGQGSGKGKAVETRWWEFWKRWGRV